MAGDLGYKSFVNLSDFTDERQIAHTFKESNVVVNLIGSRIYAKKQKDIEDSNIRVPIAIAKAVRANPKIKRFIHVSAAGADPNSHSRRLRSKWIGEQEVKRICPDVTIIRPTCILNTIEQNTTISGKWQMQMKMFNRLCWQLDGMNGLVQPVNNQDVAQAIINALKMEETAG